LLPEGVGRVGQRQTHVHLAGDRGVEGRVLHGLFMPQFQMAYPQLVSQRDRSIDQCRGRFRGVGQYAT